MQDFPPIFAIICRYHGNTLSTTVKKCSCTSTPQGKHCLCQISWEFEKLRKYSRRKIFPHFCHNMPLPWQHTFYHCQKMCLAHLHPKANICAKFHENQWKTEEVVRDARFFPHFCHNMPLPWQHTFYHCQKMCLAHLHPKANICAKFHENWWKTEEEFATQDFSPHFCHKCRYHGNTLSTTVKKCVLQSNPKANICAKFHENWWKTEEVVRDARFSPIFAIICRYHGNTLSVTVEKCVLHIYTPRQTSLPNFMRIGQKLRK